MAELLQQQVEPPLERERTQHQEALQPELRQGKEAQRMAAHLLEVV